MKNNALQNAAERFAQLVDLDNPPLVLDGGDPRMRPAVSLTAALRSTGAQSAPEPLSSSARMLMRERLVSAAAAVPATQGTVSLTDRISQAAEHGQERAAAAGRRVGKRMSALVGAVVILTSVSGVGVAAARSMPGSPFYDLKKVTESVQLWFASGQDEKGQRHLQFARTRLAEAKQLPADSPYLASTLKAMNDETRQANTELVKAYQATGSVKPLADLVMFARAQYTDLAKLGAALPKELHDQATYAAQLLTGVTHEVKTLTIGLCHKCATTDKPAPPVTTPATSKPAVTPTPSASKPSGTSSTPAAHPTHTPKGLLPTELARPLRQSSAKPLPKLTPIPLLSSLAQLLGVG